MHFDVINWAEQQNLATAVRSFRFRGRSHRDYKCRYAGGSSGVGPAVFPSFGPRSSVHRAVLSLSTV